MTLHTHTFRFIHSTMHHTHTQIEMYRMYTLYILKLQHGKWYVGTTMRSMDIRYREHLSGDGTGSRWTRRHPPLSIFHTQECEPGHHLHEERTQTYKLMLKEGVHNVRGGPKCNPVTFTCEQVYDLMEDIVFDLDMTYDEVRKHIYNGINTCTECGLPKKVSYGRPMCLECYKYFRRRPVPAKVVYEDENGDEVVSSKSSSVLLPREGLKVPSGSSASNDSDDSFLQGMMFSLSLSSDKTRASQTKD